MCCGDMTDTVHTIIAVGLMLLSYLWGYNKGAKEQALKTTRDVLQTLVDMGIIQNFVAYEKEEDEDEQG